MAARSAGRALFGGHKSIPYALFRSGTSRGIYVLEQDVPPKGPDRDAVLCRLMGSGHPQQLEGFGGGIGPTSKAVVVGSHAEPGTVTYTFAQCKVEEARVDHSHGDCGNMLAAVAPFALERGLVPAAQAPAQTTHVRIHSLNTGAVYAADVLTTETDDGPLVQYDGDVAIAGVPNPAAPVVISTFGVAGSQTGKLLPTGNAVDRFDLGAGHGEVSVTAVDFARALLVLNADEVLPKFGYRSLAEATKARVEVDQALNQALERVRRQASLAIGMGDCTGKDAPKVALVAPSNDSGASLRCLYFVNPERSEVHPALAMTAAQALGAACLLSEGVARTALGGAPSPSEVGAGSQGFAFQIAHPKGLFPVTIGTAPASGGIDGALFPQGVPNSAMYTTTVRPIAEGRAFL